MTRIVLQITLLFKQWFTAACASKNPCILFNTARCWLKSNIQSSSASDTLFDCYFFTSLHLFPVTNKQLSLLLWSFTSLFLVIIQLSTNPCITFQIDSTSSNPYGRTNSSQLWTFQPKLHTIRSTPERKGQCSSNLSKNCLIDLPAISPTLAALNENIRLHQLLGIDTLWHWLVLLNSFPFLCIWMTIHLQIINFSCSLPISNSQID